MQVLDAKPYVGGYLVRIRGEARLGISGLVQMEPYMRAQVSMYTCMHACMHALPHLQAL